MKKSMNILLISCFVILFFNIGLLNIRGVEHTAVNADNPGEKIELKKYLEKNKTNIIDFYSEFCPPCVRIAPFLTKLDEKNEDLVVIKIDINRKGVKGIDWKSPIAQQFDLKSIPHFKIFNEKGEKVFEGREALTMLIEYFKKAGIELK